jgi:hypothetical protein
LFDRLGEGAGGVRLQPHPPAAGLSLVHTYSQKGKEKCSSAVLRIAENGHVAHLRRPRQSGPRKEGSASRGKVNGLSPAAAARCKRFLLACDHSKVVGTFEGCNTLPEGEFTFADFKGFLKNWRDRFERKFPGVPVPWVEELTAKWTPHLHFVVVWVRGVTRMPGLVEFRQWNDAAWAEVVKSSHPSHKKTACRVNRVRTWDRVVHYLSSYLTKRDERQSDSGRMWGCIGRQFFPCKWVEVEVTDSERKEITRAMVRCRQSRRVVLASSASYSLRKRWGVKTERWFRLSACFKAAPRSFMEHEWMKRHREHGHRLRIIRPRLYRRNAVKLWDQDEGSGKVERRCVEQKIMRRFCPVEGKKVEVWCDEIESVAAAWHYLPAAEVLRLLAYVRRDAESGLTACEKRWARS